MSVSNAYLFHIVLTTVVLVGGAVCALRRGWLTFYSPLFMFIVSFAFLYLLHPLAVYLLGSFHTYERWFAKLGSSYGDVIVHASIVTNLAIVAFFGGFAARPRRRFPWPQFHLGDYPYITAVVFIPLLVYGMYSQILYQGTGFFNALDSAGVQTMYGYLLTGGVTGYTLDAHHFVQPICLILIFWRRTRKAGFLVLIAYGYFRLQSAWSRAALVSFGLSILCLYLLLAKKRWPTLKQAGLIVLLGLVLVARGHQELRHTGVLGLVKSSELGRSAPAFFATVNFNQFEVGAYLIGLNDEIFDQTHMYDWGRSLLGMPFHLLPRRAFPWKDTVRLAIEGETGRLYWEGLAITRPNNMGIITGFYRYAGPLGTVICMFLLGHVFRRIYEVMRSDVPDYLCIACCLVTGTIVMGTRVELQWCMANLIFVLGPLACAVAICAFHKAMSGVVFSRVPQSLPICS
jgi:hypothetical protein